MTGPDQNKLKDVLKLTDLLVAVSDGVLQSYRERGNYDGDAFVIGNGCDFKFWVPRPEEIDGVLSGASNAHVAFYQGGIHRKIDFDLLRDIVRGMPHWEFWFCGVVYPNLPEWDSLCQNKNVKYYGKLSPEEVRALASRATVGLIPFVQNELIVQRAFPIKAFEYVACGLPVVSVPINALRPYSEVIKFAETADQFMDAMEREAPTRLQAESIGRRLSIAKRHDYDLKFDSLVSADTLRSGPRRLLRETLQVRLRRYRIVASSMIANARLEGALLKRAIQSSWHREEHAMTEGADGKPRVVMFVTNDLLNDPRVQREARSAARAGFRVRVVALQSKRCRVAQETVDGYEIVRVRLPRYRIAYTPFKACEKLLSYLSLFGLVCKEGVKLALGLAPGPAAPGQATGVPTRLRQLKWGLMKAIGILFLPARPLRPFIAQLYAKLQEAARFGNFWSAAYEKLRRYVNEACFIEETLWTTYAMLKAAHVEGMTLFHGNDLPTLPLTTWAARRVRGKALYDSHELWVGMSPDWTSLLNTVAGWVERRYIRRMDAVVTVNELIAEELRRRYQIPLPTVVMNCPEPESPRALDPRHSIRAKLGLPPNEPLILYQGRYEPGRGLEALIESGRYLSRGVIVLRGYGSNEEDLRGLVAALGDSRRVFMVEPVPMADLVSAAAEADVGVVPYSAHSPGYYYASPNKLFEYMFAGLAIAVSNLPFLEKIVRDHDLGVVFDPADPKQIAEQLGLLVCDPARLRICKENATRVARDRYNWDQEGGRLVDLYRTFASGSAGPG
ncbi:MAG: glycosyltransferase [Nitrospiraceae bacterium]